MDLTKARVLVIGDVILDKYIFGTVSRISPEAPVPVVLANRDNETLGGAANVANNIAMLEANCTIIGFVGSDEYKNTLQKILSNINVKENLIETDICTTTKIRVIGERQQIVRIDREDKINESHPSFDTLADTFLKKVSDVDVVVLSDYGKGVVSEKIARHVIKTSHELNKITIVDPKGADWSKYTGAAIITPNVKELAEVAKTAVRNNDDEIVAVGQRVREKYDIKYLVVTRSEKGITILSADGFTHIPTQAKEVFDVSGAGDTVVATMACALSVGASIEKAVNIANIAAGVVVSKIGTAPITLAELTNVNNGYNIPLEHLLIRLEEHKKNGKKIIFTNGCFDIIHRGHVDYLRKAKDLGDILVVGLNSDASVKRLKGETRPVNKEDDRAFVLSGLDSVDYVVVFDEDTPAELLSEIKPNILVKGGDYTPENVIGKEYAEKVVIIDFVDGYSTTTVINKM